MQGHWCWKQVALFESILCLLNRNNELFKNNLQSKCFKKAAHFKLLTLVIDITLHYVYTHCKVKVILYVMFVN